MRSIVLFLGLGLSAAHASAAVVPYADYRMGDGAPATNGGRNLPYDASGNGRHMTTAASGTPALNPAGGPGGDAYYSFSGSNQYFSGAAGSWNPPEDNVGVEAWVRTSNLNQTNAHVFGTGNNTVGLNLGFEAAGGRGWFGAVAGIAYAGNQGLGNYVAGTWVHLAAVRTSGTTTFYVNGVATGTSNATPNDANGTSVLRMAVNSAGSGLFQGDVAAARVFTFAAGQFDPAADMLYVPPPPVLISQYSSATVPGTEYLARFEIRPSAGGTTVPVLGLKIKGTGTLKDIVLQTALPVGAAVVPYIIRFTADSSETNLRFSTAGGDTALPTQISNPTVSPPFEKQASTTPSPTQQAQIDRRYGLFMHYGINTFADQEWTDGTRPVSSYQPTALDVEQWVQSAYEAGMEYVLVITKHHDGFCMWDTRWTDYAVGKSAVPTDVVAAAAAACKKYGIKLALYYSLWDRHESSYSNDEAYNQYMLRQLSELLVNYGPVCELWFDGGWDKANTRWPATEIYDLVHNLQPDCQIGINWSIGAPTNVDSMVHPANQQTGYPIRYFPSDFRLGDPDLPKFPDPKLFTHGGESHYMPFEATITLSGSNYWFYHTNDSTDKPVADLARMFYITTAQDNMLVLNAPPDRRGKIRDLDRSTLFQLRDKLGLKPGQPLPRNVTGAAVGTASSIWQNDTVGYGPQHALDGNPDTRWAGGPAGANGGSLEIDLGQVRKFDRIMIDEYETSPGTGRITSFHLQAWTGAGWQTFKSGTTCGRFSLHDFAAQSASRIRLVIDSATDSPSIWEFQVHLADHALSAWRANRFPASNSDPRFGAEGDPDGDGLLNRVEFAIQSDPNSVTRLPLPVTAEDVEVLDIPWNPAATDSHAMIEYSLDLSTWHPAGVPVDPGISFTSPVAGLRRWTIDRAIQSRWFYRIR